MDKKNNNKKIGLIFIIVGVLIIIGSLIYTFIGTDSFKGNDDSESTEEESLIDGIYEYNDITVKIYQIKIHKGADSIQNQVLFSVNDYLTGYINMESEFVGKYVLVDDEIDFNFKGDSVDISFSEEVINNYPDFKSGTYKKIGKYTSEDVFNSQYGEATYFNSKYNGLYKNNGILLAAYQTDKNIISITIVANLDTGIYYISNKVEIMEDGSLRDVDGNFFEFKNDAFSLVSRDYPDLKGNYKKESKLTIDEVLANGY